jgi:hypothetical protein
MAIGLRLNGVEDELLSILRTGVVTREDLRQGDFSLRNTICLKARLIKPAHFGSSAADGLRIKPKAMRAYH